VLSAREREVVIGPALDAPVGLCLMPAGPTPKTVKNRVHLDLRGESMAAEVARLTALGATFIAERTLGDALRWTVMADPEGNEFCVSGG
jgi:hypothetical protein